jgi:hypothetical protein
LDSDDDSDLEEEESSQGFTMSDAATAPPPTNNVPMTPGQLAAQIPKDFGMAGVPPALSETVEAMRRIMMQQSEELAKMQAKTKSFEEQEKKRKAIEEEEAKKYAEQREPIAKDVLAEFEKAVAEEGLAPLSEGWKKLAHQMLTDNSPFSMEQQAATVACMRKINKQDKARHVVFFYLNAILLVNQSPHNPSFRNWLQSRPATWSWRLLQRSCTR